MCNFVLPLVQDGLFERIVCNKPQEALKRPVSTEATFLSGTFSIGMFIREVPLHMKDLCKIVRTRTRTDGLSFGDLFLER